MGKRINKKDDGGPSKGLFGKTDKNLSNGMVNKSKLGSTTKIILCAFFCTLLLGLVVIGIYVTIEEEVHSTKQNEKEAGTVEQEKITKVNANEIVKDEAFVTYLFAKVDGLDITGKEVDMFMNFCKSEFLAEHTEYSAENLSNEAKKELRQMAFDEIVRFKEEQLLAVKFGIVAKESITYQAMINEMKIENSVRAEKIKNGEIVYGLKEFSLESYYKYIRSNLQLELQKKMYDEGAIEKSSVDKLKEYYQNNIEQYKAVDSYKLNVCEMDDDLKTILSKQEIEINDENYLSFSKESIDLYSKAITMKEGEISDTIEYQGKLVVLECISRKAGGYRDFNKYRDDVYLDWKNDAYENYVDELVDKANIQYVDTFSNN